MSDIEELTPEEYIRKNLVKAISLLSALILGVIFVVFYFESALLDFSRAFIDATGKLGITLIIYLNDMLISPLPPDLFLLVLSKAEEPLSNLVIFVLFLGFASTAGGTSAWFLARHLIKAKWLGPQFQKFILEKHKLINRYGRWAVGLAALTPVPFSVVCWAAGFLKMDFRIFIGMALLRVPRFLFYFYILFFSGELSIWLRSFFPEI